MKDHVIMGSPAKFQECRMKRCKLRVIFEYTLSKARLTHYFQSRQTSQPFGLMALKANTSANFDVLF